MAKQSKRIFDQLPEHCDLKKAAFEYILSGKPYFGPDLAKAVATRLDVSEVDLKLKLPRKAWANSFWEVRGSCTETIH
jgi:hypothetical protein